jgi:hypothetical protein
MRSHRGLHVYSQEIPHAEAFIVGNREALEALARQIQAVLSGTHTASVMTYFAGDGEGFMLGVKLELDNLDRWVLPYYHEAFDQGQNPQERTPWSDPEMKRCMLQEIRKEK